MLKGRVLRAIKIHSCSTSFLIIGEDSISSLISVELDSVVSNLISNYPESAAWSGYQYATLQSLHEYGVSNMSDKMAITSATNGASWPDLRITFLLITLISTFPTSALDTAQNQILHITMDGSVYNIPTRDLFKLQDRTILSRVQLF